MKFRLYLFFTAHIFLYSSVFSLPGRPSVSKEPAWVTKNNINYNTTSLDKAAADGYINISFETQISLADQSKYFFYSKKIISKSGVQNESQISVSFDPSYEQLIFHSIHIIRNGEILNRLELSKIKTVQQEEELADFIYNGSLDAILILEDVRMGDIIEYSYTIKGFNPIFKNKYADEYSMEFSIPLYQIYYKLIVPQGRKVTVKNLNENVQPIISSVNGQQVYEWRKTNIAPLVLQDYTPHWHNPYAQVLVSEYNSWKEVNDWAMELFPAKKQLSAALQKKIKEIETANSNDQQKTKAALQFVQDDIRYMGIEIGVNSHKSADPSKVFAQRFVDCKEKSYLLCIMLRAMNIEASPVLINTISKKNTSELLPAPTDFDHLTVRVKLDSSFYWFDPTIAYQRGNIKNLFYPDYQVGLVIEDSTVSLTNILFRNVSNQHVKELFKVSDLSGGATLTVTTTFYGSEADNVRDNYYNESQAELLSSYKKFYADYYEDIKADSLTQKDDDSTGIFTSTEYYSIPKFWEAGKNKTKKFSFSAFVINNILIRPKEKERTMPFRIMYPAKYEEEVIIELPENWKVTESETHLKNKCYAYNCLFYCAYNRVHLVADYENYKDHATIEDAPSYFSDLAKYDETGSFSLTSGVDDSSNNSSHSSSENILSAFITIAVIAGGVIWWSQRK